MILWKRQSTDGPYVDILKGVQIVELDGYEKKKNDKISNKIRCSGNAEFGENRWTNAIVFYNKSLRFATKNSTNLSLAYANRSACFFQMGNYEKCLADIELAKKANYPPQLMSKLEKRGAECLKKMKEADQSDSTQAPVLSFPSNEKFPGFANALDVRSNVEFGKHIVATCDIEMGQIIVTEEGYVFDTTTSDNIYCKTCGKNEKNFIPCDKCTDVMFCDTQCMEINDIHKIGCRASYNCISGFTAVIESLLKAVQAFPCVDDLMKFVECALATCEFDSPECSSTTQAEYRSFLKLFGLPKKSDSVLGIQDAQRLYGMVLNIPAIGNHFDSVEKRRFLMHLGLQHFLIVRRNAMNFQNHDGSSLVEIMAIYSSFFNHSCAPNAKHMYIGNKICLFTILPVRKGEQLFIQYRDGEGSTKERRSFLLNLFDFECNCIKCTACVTEADSLRMQMDPDFQFLCFGSDTYILDDEKRLILKDTSKRFLTKYERFKWSPEIEYVSVGFCNCMLKEFQPYSMLC